MNDIKLTLLEKIVEWLTGDDAYKVIKQTVEAMMDADMTGEEKRQKVQELVFPVLRTLSKVIINIAIEVAVAVIKSQIKDMKDAK